MNREFEERNRAFIERMAADKELQGRSKEWLTMMSKYEYSYHFTWLGRPIIQFPQDMLALQEIVWKIKPDLIVETGIAHGGSLIYSASLLELLAGNGCVVGIDIDIRSHNRTAIEAHPMSKRIVMVQGSSTDAAVVAQVAKIADGRERILVMLDSNHTHDHVARELALYSPFVTEGSYLIVFDTVIEDMPEDFFPDRPWGKGNNPMTAVREFLRQNDRFIIDEAIGSKLLITVAPDGYLKCVKGVQS